jgi:hypothetical protein
MSLPAMPLMMTASAPELEPIIWMHARRRGGRFWIAEVGFLQLRVRAARPPRSGEFVGYINQQRVGYWRSAEIAKAQLEKLALFYRYERAS